MTVPLLENARQLALHVLLECKKKEAFAQELLDQSLHAANLSAADRRLATQLVYGVLRRRATLDALMRPALKRPMRQVEAEVLEILRLGVYQLFLLTHIPQHAALNETVNLAHGRLSRATGFINGVLRSLVSLLSSDQVLAPAADALPMTDGVYRRLLQSVLPDPTALPMDYLAQSFSLPDWLAARWYRRFGFDECVRLGFWFAGAAPLTLRVNSLKGGRAEFLLSCGDSALAGNHPQAVQWKGHVPIAEIPGYAEGRFVVQDESSMRVASALAPEAGQKVLDLCAAPGGKTTHLAELMKNQGSILACDVSAEKLVPLVETCGRLGLSNIEMKAIDVRSGVEPPPGPFDAVLVDVPCSNTGVLGRRPEVRWRLKPEDLPKLVQLQRNLLHQGCERLRPGGKIVYSTCSIEPEENRQVVEAILQARQDFILEADEESLPGRPADGGYWARLRRL
jgi:16S rRNA (cytosine967-C5)-methyltransferase